MKNKGIKIGVVFILLFALLSVAGCQQEDVVIVGAESGQPGPTSGQLRIGFTLLVSKGASTQPSRDITSIICHCQQTRPSPLRIQIPAIQPY